MMITAEMRPRSYAEQEYRHLCQSRQRRVKIQLDARNAGQYGISGT